MTPAEIMYTVGTILILPAILFALYAQFKVMSAFDTYSQIAGTRGMTARDLARRLLDDNGCRDVKVAAVHGHLSDHYDPRTKTVSLSDDVYNSTSLAALGIAAHEVGHAIQHHERYAPLMLRQVVIHSTGFLNKALLPLIIIGLIGSIFVTAVSPAMWLYIILGFCVIYCVSFLVNLITLPTELNASNRAKKLLRKGNYLIDENEREAVSRVLGAAAMTYVASLVVSLAYMLRFLGLLLTIMDRR